MDVDGELSERISGEKLIGLKQTLRALPTGEVLKVFVAVDTELSVMERLDGECKKYGVPLFETLSRRELGDIVGIDVPCAVVSVIKTQSK